MKNKLTLSCFFDRLLFTLFHKVRKVMPDISKCSPSDCPIKESCCRFTAESSYQQAYSAFYEKGKECKWFISNKKK